MMQLHFVFQFLYIIVFLYSGILYAIAGLIRENAKLLARTESLENRIRTLEGLIRRGGVSHISRPPKAHIYSNREEYVLGKENVPEMVSFEKCLIT